MNRLLIIALAALVPACGAGKADIDEDFTDLRSADEKSDRFRQRFSLAGTIRYGETKTVAYKNPPPYLGYRLTGQAGDEVTISVRSKDGDPYTWLLDGRYEIVAKNDDARGSLDSFIAVTLPRAGTYYVVFRDYWRQPATFAVEVQGQPKDLTACNIDADCVKVQKGCCEIAGSTAVNKDQADAYEQSLGCPKPTICPLVVPPPSYTVAQCNNRTHTCELVEPEDIACGGFSINPHQCPAGWSCRGDGLAHDAPGRCVQFCGGIASIPCVRPDAVCVDDPNDACDPNAGGADCGGICTAPEADCRSTGCETGRFCTLCWGSFQCIPDGAVC